MSGIVGICDFSGKPIDPQTLHRAAHSMSRRGPDGIHTWYRQNVGMGHCLFRAANVSQGEFQPYRDEESGLIVVADSRIDNRVELCRLLFPKTTSIGAISEAQIISHAYKRWGESCPKYIDGAFVLVVWDAFQQTFFLARDHIGTKPLYFFRSPKIFAFASQIKALRSFPDLPFEINEVRIAHHLSGYEDDKESTFYKDIFRLAPASYLLINSEGSDIHPYWNLSDSPLIKYSTDGEYADAFLDLFGSAVRSRLVSSQPIGLALSGGLDSSAICCLAEEILNKQISRTELRTFSAVFQSLPAKLRNGVDESKFIQLIINRVKLPNQQVDVSSINPLASADQVLSILEEPYFAPTLEIFWQLYSAASSYGCRVYLDGFDGDETVSHGLERFAEMFAKFQFLNLITEARAYSQRRDYAPKFFNLLRRYALKPVAIHWLKSSPTVMGKALIQRRNNAGLVRDDLQKKIDFRGGAKFNNRPKTSIARHIHVTRLEDGTIPQSLEIVNHIASYHQVEVRLPFFDKKLMEFCVGLPAEQKLSNGWTRVILRRAMANYFPEDIRLRLDKADFSSYFAYGLYREKRSELDGLEANGSKPVFSYVDCAKFRSALSRFYSAPTKNIADAQNLYATLTLSRWLDYIIG